ncbi:guanine nucleotide-binding protein G(I)/G(S)/G(O) subunit gamma-7 isoform X5 [Rhinolophus sinicus]|uniref:guanine nucleotide-binding protein G(I)/G(S)/G(O) subunit gamma-7 isoform X5 n=1 Tax=Rhinolophus sinicus TaxID=89399 RepID=UPI003D7BCFCE
MRGVRLRGGAEAAAAARKQGRAVLLGKTKKGPCFPVHTHALEHSQLCKGAATLACRQQPGWHSSSLDAGGPELMADNVSH